MDISKIFTETETASNAVLDLFAAMDVTPEHGEFILASLLAISLGKRDQSLDPSLAVMAYCWKAAVESNTDYEV